MAELFHDDGSSTKAGLLSTVTLEGESMGLVLNEVSGNWGMVGDLFDYEVGLTTRIFVRPVTVENLSENGVEWPNSG